MNNTYNRIAIVGGPRHGKSTLADQLAGRTGHPVYCSDPLSKVANPKPYATYAPEDLSWEELAPWIAEHWFTMRGPHIIEGVHTARALRTLYRQDPDSEPTHYIDQIYVLPNPHLPQDKGQQNCAKGIMTIWEQIAAYYATITQYIKTI
jgi:adenosyl cobinamide kinase/adenosyl cobinamide phosphate guanylyltransferase